MPNFLTNSFDQFNRGYRQQYGTPIAQDPAVGQFILPQNQEQPPASQPTIDPSKLSPLDYMALASSGGGNIAGTTNAPALNLAQYSSSGSSSGSGGSGSGSSSQDQQGMTALQNFFKGLFGGGGSGVPGISSIGPDVGSGGTGTYTPVTFSGSGGAGAGAGVGGGGIGAAKAAGGLIGGAISSFYKNVPNFQYQNPNIPLPRMTQFVPVSLAANTGAPAPWSV
jgi:hypothetical protein